jgi:hypothetical protein
MNNFNHKMPHVKRFVFLWSFHSNKSNQSGIHRKIKKKENKEMKRYVFFLATISIIDND